MAMVLQWCRMELRMLLSNKVVMKRVKSGVHLANLAKVYRNKSREF